MEQAILEYVVEKARALMTAPTCSEEAKAAAQAWLDAVGTAQEAEETRKFVQELEEDIISIDELIAFAESDQGKAAFGEGAPVWLPREERPKRPALSTASARPAP